MPPRPRSTFGLAAALALSLPSCGPLATAPMGSGSASGVGPGPGPGAGADPLDAIERVVTAAIARVRESSVALEYSAADAPSGARRVASGVVVGDDGTVLSVRIDAPSAAAPIVARVASGRRVQARWVADAQE